MMLDHFLNKLVTSILNYLHHLFMPSKVKYVFHSLYTTSASVGVFYAQTSEIKKNPEIATVQKNDSRLAMLITHPHSGYMVRSVNQHSI